MTRGAIPEELRRPGFAYSHPRARRPRTLLCERVNLERLTARHGTPLYVYSAAAIRSRLRAFSSAFRPVPHTICYSVKALSTLAILRLVGRENAGFDVVSAGELERVRRVARGAVGKAVFSGVGKTVSEIERALRAGILLFNVESESELRVLAGVAARLKKRAAIAIRVNPDVSAKTHPYISTGLLEHKFGVPLAEARKLYDVAARKRQLRVVGVTVHIGSQITDVSSFREALERAAVLVRELRAAGHDIRYVDAGGGLGICYQGEPEPFERQLARYADAVLGALRGVDVHLLLEPGRSIVGPAGALLTRVIHRKTNGTKKFLIVDAGMNDLLRPSLYGAHHEIVPVRRRDTQEMETTDIVGPICETGDFFARDRQMPITEEGELLAVLDTGAYGAALASNYNSRGRAAEVLVDGSKAQVIRRRESLEDQIRLES